MTKPKPIKADVKQDKPKDDTKPKGEPALKSLVIHVEVERPHHPQPITELLAQIDQQANEAKQQLLHELSGYNDE